MTRKSTKFWLILIFSNVKLLGIAVITTQAESHTTTPWVLYVSYTCFSYTYFKRRDAIIKMDTMNIKPKSDLETGIGGLIKAIASNKTSPEIITNYTRTILKGRLELLTDYNMPIEDYDKQKEYMKRIIKMASKYYDLVFIDAEGSMEDDYIKDILSETNLIIANTTQRIKYIQQFAEERKKYNLSKKDNVIYLLGKYDKYSKYNVKNLQRLRRNKDVYGIPYNTLFFEACNEGTLVDFMIKYRKVRPNSMQSSIMTSFEEAGQRIIEKLKELQLHV